MDYRVLISYSLGDAIDWKHYPMTLRAIALVISYSLGDAIDWKRRCRCEGRTKYHFSYSLGDAIDWKQQICDHVFYVAFLLLARGRD